jgi:regulator of nonsense transcripts 3
MAFLEELANPVSIKETSTDASTLEGHPGKPVKVTTTPLVQYLKEKKANKSKDSAAKSARKQESQQTKIKTSATTSDEGKKKGREGKSDRAVDKAAKEAIKILNREALRASSNNSASSKTETTADAGQSEKAVTSKSSERPRNTGMTAHIRMLQRDLGLSPAQAHRQVRRENADSQKSEKTPAPDKVGGQISSTTASGSSTVVPTAPKASLGSPGQTRNGRKRGAPMKTEADSQPGAKSTAPTAVALLKKSDNQPSKTTQLVTAPAKSSPAVSARKAPSIAVPTDGATQAFIKHANPSQGVTESLLKEALERFGPISFIEIDKRKGFAYVDFVDTEGLKKAMAANPITVAQGTVHVAQRKVGGSAQEKKPPAQNQSNPTNRGGRGGSSRGSATSRRGARVGRGGSGGSGGTETSRTASVPTGPSAK